jgi:hypothetical protein
MPRHLQLRFTKFVGLQPSDDANSGSSGRCRRGLAVYSCSRLGTCFGVKKNLTKTPRCGKSTVVHRIVFYSSHVDYSCERAAVENARKFSILWIQHIRFHDESMHSSFSRRKHDLRDLADHSLLFQKNIYIYIISLRIRRNKSVPIQDEHSSKAC